MNPHRSRLAVGTLALGVLLSSLAGGTSPPALPRMPSPEFTPSAAQGSLLGAEVIRRELSSTLPLRIDRTPPTARATAAPAAPSPTEEMTPVAAIGRAYPVLDLSDAHYAPLAHSFLPVLLDWFEAFAAGQGCTVDDLHARGLRANKVAHLMQAFTSIRMHRDRAPGLAAAPAIGWARVLLAEGWGRAKSGETHTFVVVATERGWFVIDPFTRYIRKLERDDHRWFVEFVVL